MTEKIERIIKEAFDNSEDIDNTVTEFTTYIAEQYAEMGTDAARILIDDFFYVLEKYYKKHRDIIACFSNRMAIKILQTDNEKVLEIYSKYSDDIRKWAGKNSLVYASAMYLQGVFSRYYNKDYERAMSCLQKSFEIRLKKLGRKDMLTNYALKEIGKTYECSFNVNRAMFSYFTVIQNCNRTTVEEKELVYWSMLHYSNILCVKSEYDRAYELLSNMISDIEINEGAYTDLLVGHAYHMMSLINIDSGALIEAEKNILKAIDVCKKNDIESSQKYLVTYVLILDGLGKETEAEEQRTRLLNELCLDKIYDRETSLMLRFNKLQYYGKNMSAEEFFKEIYPMVNEIEEIKNSLLAVRIYVQAVNAWIRLEPTEDEDIRSIAFLLTKLERMVVTACGVQSIMYALFLFQKALFKAYLKRYKDAYKAIKQSLEIQIKTVKTGGHVDFYIPSVNIAAVCSMHLNRYDEIESLLKSATLVMNNIINEASKSIDYDAAYKYIRKSNLFTSLFINVFDKINDAVVVERQYDVILNTKLPFDIYSKLKKHHLNDPAYARIKEIDKKLAITKIEGIFRGTNVDASELINEKNNELRNIPTKIENESEVVNCKDIFEKMPLNSFVVEYIEYSKFPTKELFFDVMKYENDFRAQYAVFILSKNISGECRIERIEDLQTYDDIMTLVYVSQNAKNEEDEVFANDCLDEMLLQPLGHYIETYDTMYIAPDGDLNKLSFGTMKYKDKILEEWITIVYINSSRNLKEDKLIDLSSADACIIGNPSFELEATYDTVDIFNWRNDKGELCELPASEVEAQRIAYLTNGTLFVKEKANKKNFLQNANKTILHICSHGYCEDTYERINDPLLASGIYFAGYNNWLKEKKIEEEYGNGFVSAEEISMLDLSNNELAVFSSCSSGLGTINFAEGTYGLRTAIKLAGGKRCIVSVWRVNDFACAVLMEKFYELLFENAPSVALRKAKLYLKQVTVEELREKGWSEKSVVERMGLSKPFVDDIFSKSGKYCPFEDKIFWGGFIFHIN